MIGNIDLQPFGGVQRRLLQEHRDSPVRIDADNVRFALELIDVLPCEAPAPDMHIGLDGQVTLLWDQGNKSIAITPHADGWISYAVEFGRERRTDRIPFIYPKLPDPLGEILRAFPRCDA